MTTRIQDNASVWPESSPILIPEPLTPPHGEAVGGQRIKVMFVDDDDDFREAATGELEDLGFEVIAVPDADSALDYFAEGGAADVIVLDWQLETGSGLDLMPQLQRRGVQIPVVFLTGMASATHEQLALDHGALDFVDKSRGMPILVRRINLIHQADKRGTHLPVQDITCGRLLLRPKISRAYWDGNDINLTVTEFNIVHLLVTQIDEYVTYRAIYDCVHWSGFVAGSGEDGFRTNVRSSIKRIRSKFNTIDGDFSEIENFPAFGYRWRRLPV